MPDMHKSILNYRKFYNIKILQLRCLHQNRRGSSLYEILGVPRNASTKEIKAAYYKKCKEHHPDKNVNDPKSHDNFLKVQKAYDILSVSDSRRNYDFSLASKTMYSTGTHARSQNTQYYYYYYQHHHQNVHNSNSEFDRFMRNKNAHAQRKSYEEKENSAEFDSPLRVMIYLIVSLAIFQIYVVTWIYDRDMNQLDDRNGQYSPFSKQVANELHRQINVADETDLYEKLQKHKGSKE